MSVGAGTKKRPFFSSDFCSSDSLLIRSILFYFFDALFFLRSLPFAFFFLLSTITCFLNLQFLLPTINENNFPPGKPPPKINAYQQLYRSKPSTNNSFKLFI